MKSLRSWATPLVIGSFLIMGVSGVLMFFHLNTTLMKGVHEWAGWALLLGVVAHVVLNWRAFSTYFKRPLAAGIMGLGAVVLAATFLPVSAPQGGGDFTRTAMMALSGGQIETLATSYAVGGVTGNCAFVLIPTGDRALPGPRDARFGPRPGRVARTQGPCLRARRTVGTSIARGARSARPL